jgi:hypothetical protein
MNVEMKIPRDKIFRCITVMEKVIKVEFDVAIKPPCDLLIHIETKILRDKNMIFNFSH